MKVTIPAHNTISKHVARFIFNNGPQTTEKCAEMLMCRGYSKEGANSAIGRMLTHLQLWHMHDKLALSDQIIRHYKREAANGGEVVPPRVVNLLAASPLSKKYIPSAATNRDDAGEYVPHTFYTSGTSPETLIRGAA